jgi:peptidoglycan/LPS O-acetylase OafA/YrhL
MVFSLHSGVVLGLGEKNLSGFEKATGQGGAGVGFFFILSGFVLAWSARDTDTKRAFWRRRGARILPGYWFAWVLGLILTVVQPGHLWHGALPGLVLLQSWIPKSSIYFGGNGVGWSLSVEALFYALFPFLFVLFRRWGEKRQMVAVAVLIAITVGWQVVLHPGTGTGIRFWLAYIFPPARLPEFAIGMLLLIRAGRRSPVPLPVAVAIALGAYIAAGFVPSSSGYLTWVVIVIIPFSLLIFTAATADLEGSSSFARWRWIVKLGEWSYAFYLLHQLVLKFVVWRVGNTHLSLVEASLLAGACLVASVGLAGLLFHFVEKPLERRFRHDRTVRATAAV